MQAERRGKPTSLSGLAEAIPTREELRELREGVEDLLHKRGQIRDPIGGVTGKITGVVLGTTQVEFSTDIEIEDKSIPVFVFRRKTKHPERVSLLVDIGMFSGSGERVRLALAPEGSAHWVYLNRSIIGQGFKGEAPTRNDIALHRQVLEILKNSQT